MKAVVFGTATKWAVKKVLDRFGNRAAQPDGPDGLAPTGASDRNGVSHLQESYLNAFLTARKAEKLEQAGELENAVTAYRLAIEALADLQQKHPKWEAEAVLFQKKKINEALTRLTTKLKRDDDENDIEFSSTVPAKDTLIDDQLLRSAIRDGSAPEGLRMRTLDLELLRDPFVLPRGLHVYQLKLSGSGVTALPDDVTVEFKLNASETAITGLPAGLKTGSLLLARCRGLGALPENLDVNFLNIEGCTALAEWPESARVRFGSVNAQGCTLLRALPASLGPLTNLNLAGCRRIESLPAGLQISGWVDLAGTAITGLPESLRDVRLRWRGVTINAQIAFFPETLNPQTVLGEPNAEIRRVMIERIGLEKFLQSAGAKVVHEDRDAGGRRQLLRVPLPGDEDLVAVSLLCPSTGRHYLVRVPPTMQNCHQAVAWTAGFDNPKDYHPIVET